MDRAKRGGQIGENGEFYEGGQFLPNTTLPKVGGGGRKNKARMVIVDGLKNRAAQPDGYRAIFELVMDGTLRGWGQPTITVNPNCNPTSPVLLALVERFNAGERFITQDEHYAAVKETPNYQNYIHVPARKGGA